MQERYTQLIDANIMKKHADVWERLQDQVMKMCRRGRGQVKKINY